jgi:hypothetical protein
MLQPSGASDTRRRREEHPFVSIVRLGLGEARALAGGAIDRAVADTRGFRFQSVADYRDPLFLPGGAKYLDLPGLVALGSSGELWLAGDSAAVAAVAGGYPAAPAVRLVLHDDGAAGGDAARVPAAAVEWLMGGR